jgi:hypothetical protein
MVVTPPSPGYGTALYVLSAPTPAVADWLQTGHPVLTVEGPVSGQVPAAGAASTNGSVRIPPGYLQALRQLPDGTPVDVVASVAPLPRAVVAACGTTQL